MEKIIYKGMTKKELRLLLGMSIVTFREYTNVRFFAELKEMGYKRTDHELTQKQVIFLIEKLGII